MATGEQVAHDAVNPLSMRASSSPIDDIATNTNIPTAEQASKQSSLNQGLQNEREYGSEQGATSDPNRSVESVSAGDATVDEATEPGQTEIAANTALADASGGSDTDTSRTETGELAHGSGLGHVRSNSVKKPTTFKSVSVTKNFLAKSAVAAPSVRTGDKGMCPIRDCLATE
jgi:hypothetical protein